jgi:NAD(P)H-quinone oxidoreductase subunit 4L
MENYTFYLMILGAFLFCSGLFVVLTKKNTIGVLVGIELMINAGLLNFLVFGQADGDVNGGGMFALFGIIIAAAGAAVALAIVLNVFDKLKTINPQEIKTLKD